MVVVVVMVSNSSRGGHSYDFFAITYDLYAIPYDLLVIT